MTSEEAFVALNHMDYIFDDYMDAGYYNAVEIDMLIRQIFDDDEKQLLKKDVEIARLEGELEAFRSEVKRLHPDDCNCSTCMSEHKGE